jgi:hypothetical protein
MRDRSRMHISSCGKRSLHGRCESLSLANKAVGKPGTSPGSEGQHTVIDTKTGSWETGHDAGDSEICRTCCIRLVGVLSDLRQLTMHRLGTRLASRLENFRIPDRHQTPTTAFVLPSGLFVAREQQSGLPEIVPQHALNFGRLLRPV